MGVTYPVERNTFSAMALESINTICDYTILLVTFIVTVLNDVTFITGWNTTSVVALEFSFGTSYVTAKK